MKRFTSLMLLLICTVTTWAQISALTELDNSKAYLLKNANDMGYAIWKSGNNLTLCGASSTYTDALDATAAGSNWQIISYEDKYYLFNVGAQKFAVTQEGPTYLTETPTPINIEAVTKGFAFNSTGVANQYMCASHQGHHSSAPIQFWYSNDNGSAWQIIDNSANITEGLNGYTVVDNYFNSQVDVVFEYYIGETLYYTSDPVKHNMNIAPQVPALAFVTIGTTDVATITESCTVKVTCTENLPFVSSTSFANATWQVIDIHSNEDNYTWKYVAEDAAVETPVTSKTQKTSLGDEYYWAFVGNLIDGFKIYNKEAGEDLTLRKAENGNTISVMSATDDRNIFKIHASNQISNSFCFKIENDSYYLNKQDLRLQGWTNNDAGSSCRSFTPASYVLNSFDGSENAPFGAIGSYSYLADADIYAQFAPAIAAVKANHYDVTALEALDALNMVEDIVASEKVAMSDGYYRIQNLYRPQNGVKNMIGIVNGERKGATGNNTNVDFIWEFKKNGESGYTVKNANYNLYMNTVTEQSLVEEANAAEYSLIDLGAAQWKLTCGGENLVMFYDNGTLGHWGSVSQNGDGAWYIIPAEDVELTINEFASVYLPFAVEVEGAKAYAVTETTETETEGEGYAVLIEKSDIPANQGAILEGNGTVKLNIISEATADWTGNKLSGSTIDTYLNKTAYVLAKDNDVIGFYKAALNCDETGAEGTTHFKNNANKAYLAVDGAEGIASYSFRFGEGTTGVENVVVENGVKAIFDLTGRRVEAITAPGIYIVNGKKVLVK